MSDRIHVDTSTWTGLPSSVRKTPGPYGDFLTEAQDAEFLRDVMRERRRELLGALVMLWGPVIRNRPRDARTGWTVYDGHKRARGEEWTIWRAVVATAAILLGRHHNEDVHGWGDSWDMGHWDSRSDGYGWSAMICNLHPRCRVSVFSDGESFM